MALLVLVSVLNKLYGNTNTNGSSELLGRQVLSSARCPNSHGTFTRFYVPLKGQAVNQNTSWLEKTEVML